MRTEVLFDENQSDDRVVKLEIGNLKFEIKKPIIWTIAGSDPDGGAGIQGDIKTIHALGGYACSIITTLIAQNTQRVFRVMDPGAEMLQAQLQALDEDCPADALKIGVVGGKSNAESLGTFLKDRNYYTVFDPVTASTSGTALNTVEAVSAIQEHILPHIDLFTPNLPEAALYADHPLDDLTDIPAIANQLLKFEVKSVLIKGGHTTDNVCNDFWTDGATSWWFNSSKQDSQGIHGTGCALSSAIATCHALGYSELDAIVIAKTFVNQGIRTSLPIGKGNHPLNLNHWPMEYCDYPSISTPNDSAAHGKPFPKDKTINRSIYAIVNRADWLKQMLPLGIKLIQLRAKDLTGLELEHEVAEAVRIANEYDATLYINDHWELALKYNAYGVHLGQDDLELNAIEALRDAGVRLGISTHNHFEAARALAYKPSYIAIGAVYHTTSKTFDYQPVGLEMFKRVRMMTNLPVVAIGGITVENVQPVFEAGADGIAVISDLTKAKDLGKRIREWGEVFQ